MESSDRLGSSTHRSSRDTSSMHILTFLQQLGYSAHEAKVYLAALELGGSTETELAERAKLARTTVSSLVESLHRKGMMNAYLKGRRRIWAAENPEKILNKIREHESMLSMLLPKLQSLRSNSDPTPNIRSFSGVEEVRKVMHDLIETKHHISAILPWDKWVALLGQPFIDDFIEQRRQHFLKIRLLTTESPEALALRTNDAEDLRIMHFLPEGVHINNVNFIYGNKAAIIAIGGKRPVGIAIEDNDIYHAMHVFFESLWLRSGGSADQLLED